MALPLYDSSGAYSRVAGNVSLTPSYPTVSAGDRLELFLAHRNNATQLTATYGGLGAWRLVKLQTQSSARFWVYTMEATGSESGNLTITVSGGTSAINHTAVIHRFTGADTSTEEAVNGQGGGSGTNPTDVSVTTTDVDRLAINGVMKNNGESILEFTGESGGDWLLKSEGSGTPTNDCRLGLEAADMAAAATINGGSCTGTSGLWMVIGYALLPVATGDNILTPTKGELELRGNTPSITTTFNLTPTTGQLELRGNTPTKTTTFNLTPITGVLELRGNIPTLNTIFVLTPTKGLLELRGNVPTLTITPFGLTPITGVLELRGNVPSVIIIRKPVIEKTLLRSRGPGVRRMLVGYRPMKRV